MKAKKVILKKLQINKWNKSMKIANKSPTGSGIFEGYAL